MDKYIQNHSYGSFQVKKDQQIIDSYTYRGVNAILR